MTTIKVDNLRFDCTSDELRNVFEGYVMCLSYINISPSTSRDVCKEEGAPSFLGVLSTSLTYQPYIIIYDKKTGA